MAALPTTPEALEAEIAAQTVVFNELRLTTDKSTPSPALDDVKKRLGDLKRALALTKNAGKEKKPKDKDAAPAAVPDKKKERLLLKTAKVRLVLLTLRSPVHRN
jgi:histidyl-tRNA synthetase